MGRGIIRVNNIIIGKGSMKIFVMGGIAAALFFSTAACASAGSTTSPSAQKQVSDAQKQVDKAQANLDAAKEKAEAGMAASDKTEWQKAEAKFENLVASGNDSKQVSSQKGSLRELDSRVLKSSDDRDAVEDARTRLVVAQTKLNVINSRLRNLPGILPAGKPAGEPHPERQRL